MNTKNVRRPFAIVTALAVVFLFGFTTRATAGLDMYEIYLNHKLLVRQYVNQPLSLESLQLNRRNVNDSLMIRYFQCNAPNKLASNRVITVKDASGSTVKEWKFTNGTLTNTAMVIPVKELLRLESTNAAHSLSLFYTADGHPQGQKLTFLQVGSKSTTFYDRTRLPIAFFVASRFSF